MHGAESRHHPGVLTTVPEEPEPIRTLACAGLRLFRNARGFATRLAKRAWSGRLGHRDKVPLTSVIPARPRGPRHIPAQKGFAWMASSQSGSWCSSLAMISRVRST